ncbi:carboxypeptidase-like regulatory domain-containing protein [Zavarzinella formosa]|uniref:carboxypeptidase-like regulatory domain-containing protein n=1 Tax=Zavarzinella formosa TaxID=360055 RepID=UPI0002D81C6B|nr:carboxypeptidase-like regulatory domain-containing protein [Zavarzinella formosa]
MKNFLNAMTLAACLCGLACNSEPPLGKAGGRVTHKGEPVIEGTVTFADDRQGLTYVADLGADGRFEFEVARGQGLPAGVYGVTITPPRPNKPALGYVAPNMNTKTEYPNIPKKYRDLKTSGLTATVKSGGTDSFVFEME